MILYLTNVMLDNFNQSLFITSCAYLLRSDSN